MSEEHESFIKTPKQLIVVVLLSFLVPVIVIVLLVKFVGAGDRTGAGVDAMSPEAVAARIQPVAKFELRAGGAGAARPGADVYNAQCVACHAAGVAGAPKFGDAAAWAPRIKTGYDALLSSALKGKGAMSPQGGGEFSDLEIGRAIVHIANAAGAKFEEPKDAGAPAGASAPAAAAPATAAPATAAPAAAAPGQRLLRQRLLRQRLLRQRLLRQRLLRQRRLRRQRLLQRPRRPRTQVARARRCTTRPASPATPPAWQAHRSSATRQLGRRASPPGWTRSPQT